jgi:probable HAF family extracellular repeat protein
MNLGRGGAGLLFAVAIACGKQQGEPAAELPAAVQPVHLTISVAGPGRVTGDAIDCRATSCAVAAGGGTRLHLEAVPDPGARFVGWSGGCAGAAGCDLVASDGLAVQAAFSAATLPPERAPTHTLTVDVSGSGRVRSDPPGIDCPGTSCTSTWAHGAHVVLTASPLAGSRLASIVGACGGTPCALEVDADQAVFLRFEAIPLRRVTVTLAGDGKGRVVSIPAGIDCPTQCSALFEDGAPVRLASTPDAISRLTQWTGACAGTECAITPRGDASIQARFDRRRFVVQDLGILPGGFWSGGNAISPHRRLVAGVSGTSTGSAGYLYDTALHSTGIQGDAMAVNDAGTVVGTDNSQATSSVFTAYAWTAGVRTNLMTFGGDWAFAQGINAAGVISGSAVYAGGAVRAAIWRNGVPVDLGAFSACSYGYGINARDMVAGESCIAAGGTHAVRFRGPGQLDDLGSLGGNYARGYGINDVGMVVGEGSLTPSGPTHAFVWNGAIADVGTLPGMTDSSLFAVNSDGIAVGYSYVIFTNVQRAMMYAEGQLIDLNSLVEPTPFTITYAHGIDESGDIVGTGYDPLLYGTHAVLLLRE